MRSLTVRELLLGALRVGLICGVVVMLIGLVGMLGAFAVRPIVSKVLTLSQVLKFVVIFGGAYVASGRAMGSLTTRRMANAPAMAVAAGLTAAVTAGLVLFAFATLGQRMNLRAMFINASPELYRLLLESSVWWWIIGLGAAAGLAHLLPPVGRRALAVGLVAVLVIGTLSDQVLLILNNNKVNVRALGWLFANKGLTAAGALALFAVAAVANALWATRGNALRAAYGRQSPDRRRLWGRVGMGLVALGLILLPRFLGSYHSEVLNQVGLFVLMGLGLNIVVGFAGMLDLGYVAFFALGAYTVAVLTSPESFLAEGGHGLVNFWLALPIAVVVAVGSGVLLGIPVLKMRGDYLAIVTLGFGEIIQRMAISNWLEKYLGGAQGIASIPPIVVPWLNLGAGALDKGAQLMGTVSISGPDKPQKLFYIILVACLVAAFVATRLKDSHLGRAWMAVREDEDVAEAMGLNLVRTKLMAFAIGAAFSGLAGALFAPKLVSIYPHSFGLLISINILALIIVGGMGNIAGVVVGALVLVGLPELLREFAEFRLLVYGGVLVAMMLYRPEGLLPSAVVRREMIEAKPDAANLGAEVQG